MIGFGFIIEISKWLVLAEVGKTKIVQTVSVSLRFMTCAYYKKAVHYSIAQSSKCKMRLMIYNAYAYIIK